MDKKPLKWLAFLLLGVALVVGATFVAFSAAVLYTQRKRDAVLEGYVPSPGDKTRAALERLMDLDVVETPLPDVIEVIAKDQGLEIQIDKRIMDNGCIGPILTYSAKGKPIRAVLDEMLKPHGLTYVVEGDVVMITLTNRP